MRIVAFVFLCVASMVGICVLWYGQSLSQQTSEEKSIEIAQGDNLRMILEKEFSYHPFFLKMYFFLHSHQQTQIFPGTVLIPQYSNLEDILSILWQSPSNPTIIVQILEWRNIYDIDLCLSQGTCLSWEVLPDVPFSQPWEFIQHAYDMEKWQEKYAFLAGKNSLEWFLYPDTYFFSSSASIDDIIHEQLQNYQKKVFPLFEEYTDTASYELLILASIVEKEERNPKEKAKVAGILKKRWESGWMIGADITACYAYAYTSEDCKANLSRHIYDTNEYNTRTMVWLPKTPINNPHIDSIRSVLDSEDSPYWYYLHDTQTGKIYYGKDEREHNENKKKYLR